MPLHAHESGDKSRDRVHVRPQFIEFGEMGYVPRFRLARTGIPAPAAYQIVTALGSADTPDLGNEDGAWDQQSSPRRSAGTPPS